MNNRYIKYIIIFVILFIVFCVVIILKSKNNEKVVMQESKEDIIIFDCDPGVDDGLAIFLMAKSTKKPTIILSTYGNSLFENTYFNAYMLNKLFNLNVDVCAGSNSSLDGKNIGESDYQGIDGLGDEANEIAKELKLDRKEVLNNIKYTLNDVKKFIEENNNITYIATGPLTNLASLCYNMSNIENHISNVYVMGGGLKIFNWVHDSEYNFNTDPEAVKVVFESNLDVTIFPLDIRDYVGLKKEDIDFLRNTGKYKNFVKAIEYYYNKILSDNLSKGYIYDVATVLYKIYPEKFVVEDKYIVVDEYGHIEESEKGNLVHVAVDMDNNLFIDKLKEWFLK